VGDLAIAEPPFGRSLCGTVDVVIPVRDGAQTIVLAIQSVLAQSRQPRRIIVVDDGSTDNTAALVSRMDSPLIDLIKTAPVGVSHARNTGIKAALAEFVAFLDADDRWHKDKLDLQLQVCSANANAAVVYCGEVMLQPTGAVTRIRTPCLRGAVFDETLGGGFVGSSSSIVVRREALLQIGCYDEALSFAEDYDLHLRLAYIRSIDFTPNLLTYIFENPNSFTRRSVDSKLAVKKLLQEISVYEKWHLD
jgi:glycosyltransferase involved in cell wall biosynthesis